MRIAQRLGAGCLGRVEFISCARLTKQLTAWARLASETDDAHAAELSGSMRTVGFKLDGSDLVGGSDCPKGSRDLDRWT